MSPEPLGSLKKAAAALRDADLLDRAEGLEMSRALRGQIDWDEVAARTSGSPYARAFLSLVGELGIR